jgi:WD40 repeat protein
LKRHKDAVLAIHSVDGIEGRFLMSGSADHTVRLWDLQGLKLTKRIEVARPLESDLYQYKDH